ncbi:MAG: hypothetical protein WCB31_09735 [Nitrososphaeraceae archaeon]
MLANKDSSSKKKDTKRGNIFLVYVSLFGFIFLTGSMLSIPSSLQTQLPVSLGVQDAYAQGYYPPQMGYDDSSYGNGGDYYYSNTYDNKRNDKSYDNNNYDYGSYDKKKKNFAEIEKFDNKLFVCDNGIVVDDRINCPQICPFGTTLEGHYVTDLDTCNIQPGEGTSCPLDTDLPGVIVTNLANCNIFEECDASSTPLGQSLGQDVKVADSALCQLSNVPNLQICEDGPFEGFAVNDQDACDTLDSVQICSATSDLPGVLTTDPATCNIFETCDLNTPLGDSLGTDVEVVDADICQLKIAVCDSDSGLAMALGLTGTIMVTDEQLCELEVTSGTTTCPASSDLAGVVVDEDLASVVCAIDLPELFTCPPDTDLAGVVTSSEDTPCNLTVCPAGTDLAGHLLAVGTSTTEACDFNGEG